MKRKNRNDDFDDSELAVADILVRLPEIILISDSRCQVGWRVKKKRSDIEQYLPSPTTCQNVICPVKQLSCKPVDVLYKKEEYWSKMVDDLTHQRELLKSKMENVKRLRNRMKALNSELKTKKQQCNLGVAIANEAGVEVKKVDIIPEPQPLQLFPCHSDRAITSVASTYESDVVNPTRPYVRPKENLDLSLSLSIYSSQSQY